MMLQHIRPRFVQKFEDRDGAPDSRMSRGREGLMRIRRFLELLSWMSMISLTQRT